MIVKPISENKKTYIQISQKAWFISEISKYMPYGVKAYADGIDNEGKRITEIFTIHGLNLCDEHCIESKESDYQWSLNEIKLILFPETCIKEKINVNGKEVCPLNEILYAFDFDVYGGLYTDWRMPNEEELKFCNENEVIVKCFGEASVIFDIKTFMAREYKNKSAISSSVNYYEKALEIFLKYHIDYHHNNLHYMGLAIDPIDKTLYV